ncbi:MAG: hypothetical protein ACREN8_11275 [Candidatus Dormibacteraceae bacterium]
MWKQSQSEEELRQLLDLVGLRYTVGRDDEGFPTANFRFAVEPDAKPIRFTAVLHEPVLIVSAHESFAAAEDHLNEELAQLNELNSHWLRGNVHLDSEGSSYQLQSGVYLGAGEHAQVAVREGILTIRDAVRWIRSGWWRSVDSSSAFEEFIQLQNLHLPSTTNAEALTHLNRFWAESGITMQIDSQGNTLSGHFSAADTIFNLKVSYLEGRVIQIETRPNQPLKSTPATAPWEMIQELNRKVDAGAIAWSTTDSHLSWQVSLPLAWTAVDSTLAQWIIHAAKQVNTLILESLAAR